MSLLLCGQIGKFLYNILPKCTAVFEQHGCVWELFLVGLHLSEADKDKAACVHLLHEEESRGGLELALGAGMLWHLVWQPFPVGALSSM